MLEMCKSQTQADVRTPIIRCGTPDCDWDFPLPDLASWRVEKCYDEFGQHCIERHGLRESDTDAQMYFDLKGGTLTLWKGE
jgi:hypothetical protein